MPELTKDQFIQLVNLAMQTHTFTKVHANLIAPPYMSFSDWVLWAASCKQLRERVIVEEIWAFHSPQIIQAYAHTQKEPPCPS